MTERAPRRRRRRRVSPITQRILAINIFALAILVAGLLYSNVYRRNLIDAELVSLQIQAEMFAGALAEGAIATGLPGGPELLSDVARQMVRRLAVTTGTRARLFGADGGLLVDSRMLLGPGGVVEVQELPPPETATGPGDRLRRVVDRLFHWLPEGDEIRPYVEKPEQTAADYGEVIQALAGELERSVRSGRHGDMVLVSAVPVQRYKQVLGALMLSRGGGEIDAAVLDVRLAILETFLVALAVTVLLSLYLAGTIARPLRRLALAAERVRRGRSRNYTLPDFPGRGDEIGELAVALRDMTQALWARMDAIERFAADVAHEIKNPLTSLRSAVETAARVANPDQQRRLMAIIQEDVQRLDRLITDIADASRLDSEMSRAEAAPVDLATMLGTLADVYGATARPGTPRLVVDVASPRLVVNGVEGRLVQVFRNVIANAQSFSPPDGTITLRARREQGWVRIEVEDEGPGIPEGKEDAIFERFYSERPPGEKFGTHSGLGLSISKQIVEGHGGTIVAENRRRADGSVAGARFIVRLAEADRI